MALFSLAELYKGPDIDRTPIALPVSRGGMFGTGGRSGAGTARQWAGYSAQRQSQAQSNAEINREWVNKMMTNLESDINDLSGKQEGLLTSATEMLQESREGMKPLEADFVGEMNRAESDVGQEFQQSRASQQRRLNRYGLSPSSGRYVGAQRQTDIAEAGARAGGRTIAHRAEQGRVEGGNFDRAKARAGLVSSAAGLGQIYGQAAAGLGSVMDRFGMTSGRSVTKDTSGPGFRRQHMFLSPLG